MSNDDENVGICSVGIRDMEVSASAVKYEALETAKGNVKSIPQILLRALFSWVFIALRLGCKPLLHAKL